MDNARRELTRQIGDPGYTPSVRRLADLLGLFTEDDDAVAKAAERAVLRIEAQYAARVVEKVTVVVRSAQRPARGRLTRLLARLVQEGRDPGGLALGWLVEALGDADPKTRRAAARGLGKLPPSKTITTALASAFEQASSDDDRRVLAEALGKAGGGVAGLEAHPRAALIAERDRAREAPGAIDPTRSYEAPLRIWFHTRSGLEDVLREELGPSSRFVAPGIVEAKLEGPLAGALAIRTATHVGFPLPGGPDEEAIIRALGEGRAIFRAFTTTDAPIRFRLAFAQGGHRRAIVWRIAERVRAEVPGLLNDPRASTWEVVVSRDHVELVPSGHADTRFDYRQDLVAAASHPVIAAALARVAPRTENDVVWDPFAGSGAELIERARIGPFARLVGTDIDPKAVAAARANAARAGVTAEVTVADACEAKPEGVTSIVTNPPMGRRVHRGTHAALLERFVVHAARILRPGGTLVWLVPDPRQIRAVAERHGFRVERAFSVDMGGFSAELAVYRLSVR